MTKDNRPPTLRDWLGFTVPFDFTRARALGGVLGFTLTLVALAFAALFFLSLAAAGSLVFGVFTSEPGTASLGLGALLVALLGAPFLIWRTVVAQRTLDTAQRQADMQAEAHFNDKINAAATDLAARRQVTRVVNNEDGNPLLEKDIQVTRTEWEDDLVTRAAAIDRLEGLALEALDRHDYASAQRIARMLSIYVQVVSPARDANPRPPDASLSELLSWAYSLNENVRKDAERAVRSLGRINPKSEAKRKAFDPRNIDLSVCNLQGFYLFGLRFDGVIFHNSRLEGVDLEQADLNWCDLTNTNLEGANLLGTRIQGAVFWETQLMGIELGLGQATTGREARETELCGSAAIFIDESSLDVIQSYWPEIIAFQVKLPKGAPNHWVKVPYDEFDRNNTIDQWRVWAATLTPPATTALDYRAPRD